MHNWPDFEPLVSERLYRFLDAGDLMELKKDGVMKKSLIATCVALLVAVAIPSAASALELYSGATKLPLGTSIVAKSYGVGLGDVQCAESKLTGTLESNGIGKPEEGQVKIPFTSNEFRTDAWEPKCKKNDGTKVDVVLSEHECLYSSVQSLMYMQPFANGGCSGTIESHYLYFVGSGYVCQYSRASTLIFNRVNKEPLEVAVAGAEFKKISGPVGPCWSGFNMSARYTITAPGYGPLHLVA
jgi:hypothetical protein